MLSLFNGQSSIKYLVILWVVELSYRWGEVGLVVIMCSSAHGCCCPGAACVDVLLVVAVVDLLDYSTLLLIS